MACNFYFCLAFLVTFACMFVTRLIHTLTCMPHTHTHTNTCTQPEQCALPKQTGDCSEKHARWHFSETEKRCLPFYYTGCGGNKNSFPSLESCETHCPRQVGKPIKCCCDCCCFQCAQNKSSRVSPANTTSLVLT